MTSCRSSMKASRAWIILVALLLLTGVASAGRKRIVVLEFEGDKAEQFHEDVVKLIKKSHTVVSVDKWNGAAEELSATKVSDKNIKKVAKKLKIDGVVSGTVEKRRDEYILRMKLRSGASGEIVGSQVNIKSESAKLDSTAAKDVKDELIEVIASLESNRDGGGGGDEEEEKPTKKKPAEEEEKPKKVTKKPAEEEEKPTKKKPAEEEVAALKTKKDGEEKKPTKPDGEEKAKPDKSKSKKVATKPKEEEEEGGEVEGGVGAPALEGAAQYAPGERAVDAALGVSFTARRMAFTYDPNMTSQPAGYKGIPAPGVFIDATVYPLSVGHKRKDILRHVGGTLMFDRVVGLNSKNPNDGTKLSTTEQRIAIGGAFRYPLGSGAKAPVVGAALRLGNQKFSISGMAVIPNVSYTMIDATAFFSYPLNPQMVLNFSLAGLLPFGAGDIALLANYGRATLTGFEGSGGLDYMLMKNIFVRGEVRAETIGYAFKKEGMKSRGVSGARDSYFGGALTAGFLF